MVLDHSMYHPAIKELQQRDVLTFSSYDDFDCGIEIP